MICTQANATAEPERAWVALAGSAAVGCVTNWVALLWIFRPVDPVALPLGLGELQGCFLRRQPAVARDFAAFFAARILTARNLLGDALAGPRSAALRPRLRARVAPLLRAGARELLPPRLRGAAREPGVVDAAAAELAARLPAAVPDAAYAYADAAFDLEATLGAAQGCDMPNFKGS